MKRALQLIFLSLLWAKTSSAWECVVAPEVTTIPGSASKTGPRNAQIFIRYQDTWPCAVQWEDNSPRGHRDVELRSFVITELPTSNPS